MTDYNEYKNILKSRLKAIRYHHSLCVADEARRLAEEYGANPEKAYLAGLLHDITKNAEDEEQFKILSESDIIPDDITLASKKLWHAVSGAAFVRKTLKINDDEVLTAIRYHTTARADMSLLEKILYLADFTSLDRDYDDVDIMRKKVDESLQEALRYALSYTIKELVDNQCRIHPDTVAAFNQIIKGEN